MPGFPIRTPSDLSSVSSSPRLIAASYVLHRLLMPRHPPCALNNLTTKMLASTVQFSNNHPNTSPHANTRPDTHSHPRYIDQQGRGKKNHHIIHTRQHSASTHGLRMFPQDPTVHRTPPTPAHQARSTIRRPVLSHLTARSTQGAHLLVVPHLRAPHPPPPTGSDLLCSLERR